MSTVVVKFRKQKKMQYLVTCFGMSLKHADHSGFEINAYLGWIEIKVTPALSIFFKVAPLKRTLCYITRVDIQFI